MRNPASGIRYCRSCGAPIYWLTNRQTGKLGPINARREPGHPKNNVLPDLLTGTYRVVEPGRGTHTSHFATCPNAAQHVKPT